MRCLWTGYEGDGRAVSARPPWSSSERREVLRQGLPQPLFGDLGELAGGQVIEDEGVEPTQKFRVALLDADVRRRVAQDELRLEHHARILVHQILGHDIGGRKQLDLTGKEGRRRGGIVIE